jgi:large subunit ribosomal protein L29
VKASEIRELDTASLLSKEKDLKEQVFNLRFQNAIGQLDKKSNFKLVKKDIARIKTILRQRQAAEAKSAVNKG